MAKDKKKLKKDIKKVVPKEETKKTEQVSVEKKDQWFRKVDKKRILVYAIVGCFLGIVLGILGHIIGVSSLEWVKYDDEATPINELEEWNKIEHEKGNEDFKATSTFVIHYIKKNMILGASIIGLITGIILGIITALMGPYSGSIFSTVAGVFAGPMICSPYMFYGGGSEPNPLRIIKILAKKVFNIDEEKWNSMNVIDQWNIIEKFPSIDGLKRAWLDKTGTRHINIIEFVPPVAGKNAVFVIIPAVIISAIVIFLIDYIGNIVLEKLNSKKEEVVVQETTSENVN
jgi:uncharacterized membrane protein YeaQ/YmgE (transglycosylase-associated protein family)